MTYKKQILKIIQTSKCGYSVKKILKKINYKINKTTIYRNIEKLLLEWIIVKDFSESWENIYSIAKYHHHHFICLKCWKKENIKCFLSKDLKEIENNLWLKVKNHSFLLNWFCKECK